MEQQSTEVRVYDPVQMESMLRKIDTDKTAAVVETSNQFEALESSGLKQEQPSEESPENGKSRRLQDYQPFGTRAEKYLTESEYVPVTRERPMPRIGEALKNPGEARFNQAADQFHPLGSEGSPQRSVLQQHVDFFDRNKDGAITPWETFESFRILGFNVVFSILAVMFIHPGFSLATNESGWWPLDPLFRIYTRPIHKAKHGSDSGVYDTEGRFVPQKFEEIFSKWDKDGDGCLSLGELFQMSQDLRVVMDVFGWIANKFEWGTVWLLCADRDGLVTREQVRSVLDGTLFYLIEQENQQLKQ